MAVFTGTTSKLTNFLSESDEELKRPTEAINSRGFQLPSVKYYPMGSQLFLPFYRTTTTGSCLYLLDQLLTKGKRSHSDMELPVIDSEYKRAVFYGRPLFAQMAKDGELNQNIGTILLRMVRDVRWHTQTPETWIQVLSIWINILSTRVQLGQTTTEIASELVARSYANIFGYFPGSRAILMGYSPDPVCAHLAMCMMDDTFKLHFPSQGTTETIKGENHKSWTAKLKTIFSSGLISPDKGNFGEVVTMEDGLNAGKALYSHASASWKAAYTSLRNSLLSTKPAKAFGQQESTIKAVAQSKKTKG